MCYNFINKPLMMMMMMMIWKRLVSLLEGWPEAKDMLCKIQKVEKQILLDKLVEAMEVVPLTGWWLIPGSTKIRTRVWTHIESPQQKSYVSASKSMG